MVSVESARTLDPCQHALHSRNALCAQASAVFEATGALRALGFAELGSYPFFARARSRSSWVRSLTRLWVPYYSWLYPFCARDHARILSSREARLRPCRVFTDQPSTAGYILEDRGHAFTSFDPGMFAAMPFGMVTPSKAQAKSAQDAIALVRDSALGVVELEIAAIKLLREYTLMSLRDACNAVRYMLGYNRYNRYAEER